VRIRNWVLLGTMALCGADAFDGAQPQQSPRDISTPTSQYRSELNTYCVSCHNEKLKTAGLMLDKIDLENVPASAETWEKVIRKLRGGAMPPPGLRRPDQDFYNNFSAYLETSIDRAAAVRPNPGRPAVHRLNRAEYANSVRDLLNLDFDVESLLPVDDSGYGFDNIGDVLSVSPALLERYLSAARQISRLAIGDPAMRPVEKVYEVPIDLAQRDRMSEELPLGSRGGIAIHHNFPVDGEYVIKVRLRRVGHAGRESGIIRGVSLKRQIDVRLDKARLKLFTVGGEHYGKDARPGLGDVDYDADPKQDTYERHGADAGLEIRIPATAGPHVLGIAFLVEDASEPEGVIGRPVQANERVIGRVAEPWVDTVEIVGPYNAKSSGETPSHQKIFVCHQDDTACASKILSTLAHRAYRRPLTDVDVQALLKFYEAGRSAGGFDAGIRSALERILVGPDFLFRIERAPAQVPANGIFEISDLDLASRLSFFLWSSVPDDELLGLAERGKLKDPAVSEQQVRRMLRDPRAKALVKNFFSQWLQLRHVEELVPDPVEFRDFDVNLREAFRQETEMFLGSMLREDRPLMELLDANYTFVNERLARHYGIPNIYGSTFRRVPITDDNRRGLLGQGSILSLTSYATRTSVVLRGKWLLENIMGTPPPAPPPNVPALKDRTDDGKIKSVRQSMEEHRANPVCASCHLRMDPLGFAMENFNAIGKWRTTEGEARTPIDSSGVLPDGAKFDGPAGLRNILLGKPHQFATTTIEKLLTYALGRGVEYFDEPVVRKIRREAAPDYRWSSLIMGIVNSEPFRQSKRQEP